MKKHNTTYHDSCGVCHSKRSLSVYAQWNLTQGFVLAPAIDQPCLYKHNTVKPQQISSKCINVCMSIKNFPCAKTLAWTWVFCLAFFFPSAYSPIPLIPSSLHLCCLHLRQARFTVFIALMQWVATLAGYYWFCKLGESIYCLLQVCTVHTERK